MRSEPSPVFSASVSSRCRRMTVRLGYAVGHVLNDLTASVWFTYTLVFFHAGIGLSSSLAGLIMLIGQVVDGLSTPVVGLLSDLGLRKSSRASNTNENLEYSHLAEVNSGQILLKFGVARLCT
ncbi:unnamed protein product [Protopolystoma xenopodis]|uniref:Uncharacterized protein n=1 Tax=Protopolystoma xenopodis TaxID=117903 RepID=A0A3S5BBD9_9PLAT|nr:unnamed protein product [Protopolystoma xenopodis]